MLKKIVFIGLLTAFAYASDCAGRDGLNSLSKEEYTEAIKLVEDCKEGDLKSCLNLGAIYENIRGKKNVNKAIELFTKVCDGNYSSGCSSLGMLYDRGKLVPTDRELAVQYYIKSCKLGNTLACIHLKRIKRYEPEYGKAAERKYMDYVRTNSYSKD